LADRQAHIRIVGAPRRLAVVGNRVVDVGRDSCAVERSRHARRLGGEQYGEVRDVVGAVAGDEAAGAWRERLRVAADDAAARAVLVVETPEPGGEPGGLPTLTARGAAP